MNSFQRIYDDCISFIIDVLKVVIVFITNILVSFGKYCIKQANEFEEIIGRNNERN